MRSTGDSIEMKLRNFSRGDVVIRTLPFASALHPQLSGKYCDECFAEISLPSPARCTKCPFVNYCSLSCKKTHSKFHSSLECGVFKAFIPEIPDVTFRLFMKLLYILRGRKFSEFGETLFTGQKRTFQDLMDHQDDIRRNPTMFARFRAYMSFIRASFPGNLKITEENAFQVFGRMMINRFSVQNNFLEPIGEALYIGPSIHDHSCNPDAGYTFNGKELTITVLKDMQVSGPQEIYICYIDILQPLEDRLCFLEEHYFFRCQCPFCSQPNHPINKIRVTKENLRDSLRSAMQACLKNDDEYYNIQGLANVFERARFYIADDDTDEAANGKITLKYWKLDALAVAFECALRLKLDDEALEYGNRLLAMYKLTYGELRPCISVLCLRVAEVSKYKRIEQLQSAAEIAAEKLRVTHGVDHPLFKKAMKLLDEE